MKRTYTILGLLLIITRLFVSCNYEAEAHTIAYENTTANLYGEYNLTSLNTGKPVDFNGDGIANKNQMEECDCYANSKIVLNEDYTFIYKKADIIINEVEGTYTCAETEYKGSWQVKRSTNTISVIHAVHRDAKGEEQNIMLYKNNDKLSLDYIFMNYPNINTSGEPFYDFGSLKYVFTQQ